MNIQATTPEENSIGGLTAEQDEKLTFVYNIAKALVAAMQAAQ